MLFGIIDLKRQPFKWAFIRLAYLGAVFVGVPVWSLQNLLPSWRPRRSWSITRCIRVKFTKFGTWLNGQVGGITRWPSSEQLELHKGELGLWVQGVPELVTGKVKEWADFAGVSPVQIPGYWEHKSGSNINMGEKPKEGEKVVYFLHGGGYVVLSAHPSSPTSAALLDALAGYGYLVNEVGYKPSDIVVIGDSAGGNLALALARYLVDYPDVVPGLPGGLVLLSPWADLTGSHEVPGGSEYTLAETDFLTPPSEDGKRYAPRAFVGPQGMDFTTNPYISPASKKLAHVSFKGFPRSFVVAGNAEMLLDQIRTLKERMISTMASEQVTYLESDGASHDFIGFPWFEPQRGEALAAIGHWIKGL